jgi:transcriptional regulator with XRE-family HTH domain
MSQLAPSLSADTVAMTAKPSAGLGSLRAQRRDAGLSQQQLAQLAGCSLSYVALLEKGYRPGDSTVLPGIVAILNGETPEASGAPRKSAVEGGRDEDYPG